MSRVVRTASKVNAVAQKEPGGLTTTSHYACVDAVCI